MNAFLPKPVDFGELLPQIAALLQLKWRYALPPHAKPSSSKEDELLVSFPDLIARLHAENQAA